MQVVTRIHLKDGAEVTQSNIYVSLNAEQNAYLTKDLLPRWGVGVEE